MANDFKVLFGLEYDDSDKLIRSQLNEIAKKISKDGLLQIAVNIDPNIQNTLQGQLQKMLDKMQLSVGVSAQNIGVGVSKKEVKSTSKEVDNQAKSYKKLNRILTETYRMSKDADVGKFKGFIDASTLEGINTLSESAEELNKKYESGNVQGFTGEVEKLSHSLDKLKVNWHKVTKDKQSDTWAYQQSINFKNLESQAQNYFTKFGANIRKSPKLLDQYTEFFDKLNTGAFKTDKEASEYYKSMIKGFRAAGVEVETFSGKLKELFNKHIKTTLAMAAIGMLSQGLRLMYQNVLDIDLAMTELKKVTDLTDEQYSKFLDNANTRAIKLGATIKDVVNATSEFVKLGFTVDDASAIADAALIYKNVGDGIHSINDASQAIISTLKSFKIPASEALEIVDRYNEVSNKFSVTSADIGAILSRSASALAAAGNDINQAIGLGVAGNVVVQNAEKVGTVLSTLSMRIRGASKALIDAGLDTEGMAKSTSDLRQRIIELTDVTRDGSGFDIMIDDSTLKSTYEILKGISEVYGSMKDIERAELLELLAGKRNANVTESILRNFDDAEAAMKVSMDSYGSALAENEKRLDSIRGRTQQLQAAFESLSTTVINSELVKGGIGFLRTAVQLVDAFATTFGTLPTLVGAVTAGLSLSGQNAGGTEKVNMPTLPERSKFDLQWRGVSILDRRRHPNCWNGVRAA